MTEFWREGYSRTSKNGTLHEVSGAWVNRDDWGRSNSTYFAPPTPLSNAKNHAGKSPTARYVNSNAKCPVCGASVFYYQNEFGSRVFFDELAPLWPKHPCTDNSMYCTGSGGPTFAIANPSVKTVAESTPIEQHLEQTHLDPEADFIKRYGTKNWKPWQIVHRQTVGSATLLVLKCVRNGKVQRAYLSGPRLPIVLSKSLIVFYSRSRLAWFDLSTMEPRSLRVRRLPNAAAFIQELAGNDDE